MNQYSDIRLGGTLITTAIVICGGLAVAVLLPVLRTHRQQPQPGTHGSEIGSASDTTTLLPLEQLPDEESSRRSQLKTKNTEAQNKAIHRASIAQLVAQTDTGNTPAADQSREAPPTENSDGLHVPVNIHVDGSEFVESLTRLANSM
ncbi:MAG: hypothetical protein MK102_17510, partial [Fuerstiella sp.]|nr:hypothetical protein [Fuerstiella sp.]